MVKKPRKSSWRAFAGKAGGLNEGSVLVVEGEAAEMGASVGAFGERADVGSVGTQNLPSVHLVQQVIGASAVHYQLRQCASR